MPFAPISIKAFLKMHAKANPTEDIRELKLRLSQALKDQQAGETCDCGQPIWVIGSAVVRHACFSCITGEADPSEDYEIADAC